MYRRESISRTIIMTVEIEFVAPIYIASEKSLNHNQSHNA